MSYIRYFMPMMSEASGYGYKGRQPAGRSLVEGRDHDCKLTIWAQDLRAEAIYNAYLLFADGGRYPGIEMGTLRIDEKGKGELRQDFNKDTLCGFALNDIVAVTVLAKDAAGVVSPLCGYKDAAVSWRHSFYVYEQTVLAYKQEDVPVSPAQELPAEPPAESTAPESNQDTTQTSAPEPEAQDSESEIPAMPAAHVAENCTEPPQPPAENLPTAEDTHAPASTDTAIPPLNDLTRAENHECINALSAAGEADLKVNCDATPAEATPIRQEPAVEEDPACQEPTPEEEPTCQEPAPEEAPVHQPEEPLIAPDEWQIPAPQAAEPQAAPSQELHLPPNQYTTQPKGEIAKSFRTSLDQLRADTLGRLATHTHQPHKLDALFETKEAITPFQRQARETGWVSFTLADPVPPPVNRPHLFEDPFILTTLEEYGYLILGRTTDSGPRRFIIGVPGIYDNESRQKARRLGFSQFKSCNDAHPSWGEHGYWLIFISA